MADLPLLTGAEAGGSSRWEIRPVLLHSVRANKMLGLSLWIWSLNGSLKALNGSLNCTGALCELDATPSICVAIAFTERSVRCALCSKPMDTQYFYSIFLCVFYSIFLCVQQALRGSTVLGPAFFFFSSTCSLP